MSVWWSISHFVPILLRLLASELYHHQNPSCWKPAWLPIMSVSNSFHGHKIIYSDFESYQRTVDFPSSEWSASQTRTATRSSFQSLFYSMSKEKSSVLWWHSASAHPPAPFSSSNQVNLVIWSVFERLPDFRFLSGLGWLTHLCVFLSLSIPMVTTCRSPQRSLFQLASELEKDLTEYNRHVDWERWSLAGRMLCSGSLSKAYLFGKHDNCNRVFFHWTRTKVKSTFAYAVWVLPDQSSDTLVIERVKLTMLFPVSVFFLISSHCLLSVYCGRSRILFECMTLIIITTSNYNNILPFIHYYKKVRPDSKDQKEG